MKRNSSKTAENSAKKHSGFTLVELVVVIAVLAILAGVGAVAYKGYIKKAKEAADLELLSAVNTAYQAACTDEGMKSYPIRGIANLTGEKEAKIVNLDSVAGDGIKMKDSFSKYYKGNEEKSFKTYKQLRYMGGGVFAGLGANGTISLEDGTVVSFKETEDGYTEYTFKKDGQDDVTYKVSDDVWDAVTGSTFGDMQVSKMFDYVDNLKVMFGKAGNQMKNLMGGIFAPFVNEVIEKEGIENSDEHPDQLGNAAILYLGSMYEGYDYNKVGNALATNGYVTKDIWGLAAGGVNSIRDLGFSFGMVSAFANSQYGTTTCTVDGYTDRTWAEYYTEVVDNVYKRSTGEDGKGKASGGEAIVMLEEAMTNITKDSHFSEYYKENGEADAKGYLNAMKFLSENKESLKSDGAIKDGLGSSNKDIVSMFDTIFQ